jgi:oligoendopeptidase F
MELTSFPYLDEFYTEEEASRAQRLQLQSLAKMLPWIATIDAFQHWIYDTPTHSRQEREEAWVNLEDRFGSALDWSGLEHFRNCAWHRQLHPFQVPFYYIEYGIAQLGALQLWLQFREDPERALRNYAKALSLGGSRPLPELFEAAGLEFRFDTEMMGKLMDTVGQVLTELPE